MSGAITIVAAALISLIWIVTAWTIREQAAGVRVRAEQSLAAQASVIAETVAHELLMIDQSLTLIQQAWQADSGSVDLAKWKAMLPALLAVADDLFIADEKRIIRQDVLPAAVGQGIGAAYVPFPHGSLEQIPSAGGADAETAAPRHRPGPATDARQFLVYLVRPLDHPKDWFVGASYRSKELVKLFVDAALGYNPVVSLIDTRHGTVQAVIGPAARRPTTDLTKTRLYGVLERASSGVWLGETAIDGAERLHAFHRVAGRDMAVLVAASWAEIMQPARDLEAGAHTLAFVGSGLVAIISGLVLWAVFKSRDRARKQQSVDRNRRELERLRATEASLTTTARHAANRLQVVLNGAKDGIALLDPGLRLIQWNHRFSEDIGIDLRPDMPLDTLIRNQAARHLFEPEPSAETEIARRLGLLSVGEATGLPQAGRHRGQLLLRSVPVAEGGLMLLLNA